MLSNKSLENSTLCTNGARELPLPICVFINSGAQTGLKIGNFYEEKDTFWEYQQNGNSSLRYEFNFGLKKFEKKFFLPGDNCLGILGIFKCL